MSLTREELDKVYIECVQLYRRKERDREIRYGINVLYQNLLNYTEGKEVKRL